MGPPPPAPPPGKTSKTFIREGVTKDPTKVYAKKPTICLTFDDGPNAGTEDVLLALERKTLDGKATFFLVADSGDQTRAKKKASSALVGVGITLPKNESTKFSDEQHRVWEKHASLIPSMKVQYDLVMAILKHKHELGNHGYDHYPEAAKAWRDKRGKVHLGYREHRPVDVQLDFDDNREYFENLFKLFNNTFPGFRVARLPGDGRTKGSYVDMIRAQLDVCHIGWHFEFTTHEILENEWKSRDRKGEFSKNWLDVHGVAATPRGRDYPKDLGVVLLHDAHWAGRSERLEQMLDKLIAATTIVSLTEIIQRISDDDQVSCPTPE